MGYFLIISFRRLHSASASPSAGLTKWKVLGAQGSLSTSLSFKYRPNEAGCVSLIPMYSSRWKKFTCQQWPHSDDKRRIFGVQQKQKAWSHFFWTLPQSKSLTCTRWLSISNYGWSGCIGVVSAQTSPAQLARVISKRATTQHRDSEWHNLWHAGCNDNIRIACYIWCYPVIRFAGMECLVISSFRKVAQLTQRMLQF